MFTGTTERKRGNRPSLGSWDSSGRRDIEKVLGEHNPSIRFDKMSSILNDILQAQISPSDKTSLGYTIEQNASKISSQLTLKIQRWIYANILKNSKDHDNKTSNRSKYIEVESSRGTNESNNDDYV